MQLSRRNIVLIALILLLFAIGALVLLLIVEPETPAYQLAYRHGSGGPLHVIDLDTRQETLLENTSAGDWHVQAYPSPDSAWIARWSLLIENYWWQLELVDAASGATHKIGEFSPCDARAAWSPDGHTIALSFITDPGDQESVATIAATARCEIHLYDVGAATMTRITDNDFAEVDPAYAPDGTHLVITAAEDGYNRLYILDLASGERRLLTAESFGYRAAWSPDGCWIAFMSNHEAWNDDIYIIAPDGTHLQRLTTSDSPDDYPQWVVAGAN